MEKEEKVEEVKVEQPIDVMIMNRILNQVLQDGIDLGLSLYADSPDEGKTIRIMFVRPAPQPDKQ